MESNEIIWQELKNLKHVYDDLKKEIANITNKKNEATQTSRRGALTTSGVTAERILKYIYRKEGKEVGAKPADKLMLDELISELSERAKPSILPHHVVTHLRTVQAWRNLGGHDKGDFSDVNDDTLIGVNIALNAVVSWFFENYLGGEFAELANNNELKISSAEKNTSITEHEKMWQDYFWYANRNTNIRAIEASYLNSLKIKFNINEERIEKLKKDFQRNVTEFNELIEQAFEDGKLEEFEADAVEHTREICCISVAEAKEIVLSYIEKSMVNSLDANNINIPWLKEAVQIKKVDNSLSMVVSQIDENDKISLFHLENTVLTIDETTSFVKNDKLTNILEESEFNSGDLVRCIQSFQTIIGGSSILINSDTVYTVDSIDKKRSNISLKEFSGSVQKVTSWLPSSSFTSIFHLPLLEDTDLGPQDLIVCCKTESNTVDFHSELKRGNVYSISNIKKDKRLVALVEFPQTNVSEKKKWFQFDYFRVFEILPKAIVEKSFNSTKNESLSVTNAEIEIMMATINGMLKSFKGDKKKWALQFNNHELFSLASGVLNGKIKNSDLKNEIILFLSRKKN